MFGCHLELSYVSFKVLTVVPSCLMLAVILTYVTFCFYATAVVVVGSRWEEGWQGGGGAGSAVFSYLCLKTLKQHAFANPVVEHMHAHTNRHIHTHKMAIESTRTLLHAHTHTRKDTPARQIARQTHTSTHNPTRSQCVCVSVCEEQALHLSDHHCTSVIVLIMQGV